MAKILLVNQFYSSPPDMPDHIFAALPINLLYLDHFLKKNGLDSKIVEFGAFKEDQCSVTGDRFRCGLTDDLISTVITSEMPAIVGIGCMYTRHYHDVLTIARLIKTVSPTTTIVLGGNHATCFPGQVLLNEYVDFVVIGEGEVTFLELCNAIIEGAKDYGFIKGLAFRNSLRNVEYSEKREMIKDLDETSIDYKSMDLAPYLELSSKSPFLMRYPAMPITTSRGCPNKCIYCTVKSVYGRTWRGKSPKKVVDEIQSVIDIYRVSEFLILDDSASVNKERWISICDEIIKRKLNIRWTTPNGIAHWTLDAHILDKMKKAGCYRITFGIESGNDETRKYLGKPFPLRQAAEIIQHANEIGMWTICTNILGFPYETRSQLEDTIKFAKQCGTDFAAFFLLVPHVTADVYQDFKKEGLLDYDRFFSGESYAQEEYEKMSVMINDGGTPTKFFSAADLKTIQMRAYRSFLLYRVGSYLANPFHILRKIRSLEDFMYMMRLAKVGIRIFFASFRSKTTKGLLYSIPSGDFKTKRPLKGD